MAPSRAMAAAGGRAQREEAARRRAPGAGTAGFPAMLALPILLWHRVVAGIAAEFHPDPRYLIAGWAPWALMAGGLVCLLVAAVVDHRERDHRFYGTGSRAWVGWGL